MLQTHKQGHQTYYYNDLYCLYGNILCQFENSNECVKICNDPITNPPNDSPRDCKVKLFYIQKKN